MAVFARGWGGPWGVDRQQGRSGEGGFQPRPWGRNPLRTTLSSNTPGPNSTLLCRALSRQVCTRRRAQEAAAGHAAPTGSVSDDVLRVRHRGLQRCLRSACPGLPSPLRGRRRGHLRTTSSGSRLSGRAVLPCPVPRVLRTTVWCISNLSGFVVCSKQEGKSISVGSEFSCPDCPVSSLVTVAQKFPRAEAMGCAWLPCVLVDLGGMSFSEAGQAMAWRARHGAHHLRDASLPQRSPGPTPCLSASA